MLQSARIRILLLAALVFTIPFSAFAALVNINTADAALLDTLPDIGPSKAAAIIAYRTEHGPFARIEDIQDVTGIGPSIYTKLAPLITVSDVPAADAVAASTSTLVASVGASTYVPPPSTITVTITGGTEALAEVPFMLYATVKTKSGTADPAARVVWSFGDGSASEGTAVEKVYRYPGTYLVQAIASDGGTQGKDDRTVSVTRAQARISAISGEGITIANDADERLDLSRWRIAADTGIFRIPDGTTLLPHANVLFPAVVTNLPIALRATLAFPNGVIAAVFPGAAQPGTPEERSTIVQPVEPAFSTSVSVPVHDVEAVQAPTAAMELAAVGAAALPPAAAATDAVSRTSLLRSPWALGMLGVIALAGGALMIL